MYANAVVKIVLPPARVTRFRYATCKRKERIQGFNSTEFNPTFMTLSVHTPGYAGKFILVVSCVSANRPFMPHPNSLLGEHCREGFYKQMFESNGVYPTIIQFEDLSIERSRFADVMEKLNVKEGRNIDPFRTGFSHKNKNRREFKLLIDTKEVRLCFQVFLIGDLKTMPMHPVLSNVIYNNQQPGQEIIPAHVIRHNQQRNHDQAVPNNRLQQRNDSPMSIEIRQNQQPNQEQAVLDNHLQQRNDNSTSIEIRHNQQRNQDQAVPNNRLQQRNDSPMSIEIHQNQQANQEQAVLDNHLQQRNDNSTSIEIRHNQQPNVEQSLLNNHLQQRNDNAMSIAIRHNEQRNQTQAAPDNHLQQGNDNLLNPTFLLLFPHDDIPFNYINQYLNMSHSQKFDINKQISDLSNELSMISLEGRIKS